jgi:hypothetical protein
MTSFTIMYIILGLSLIREIKASNMWPPCMEGYVEINGDGDGASSCVEIDDGSDNNLWRKFLTLYEPFYRDDYGSSFLIRLLNLFQNTITTSSTKIRVIRWD